MTKVKKMICLQKNVVKLPNYSYPVPFFEKLQQIKVSPRKALKLDYNEPTFGPSKKVKDAIQKYLADDQLKWYPEGECKALRKVLMQYTKRKYGEIMVVNGSDEILLLLALAYLSEGDEVIIPVPNYEMFMVNAKAMGAKQVDVLCQDDMSFNVKEILAKVTPKTKIIYLSNPNSPTGFCFRREEIISLLESAKNILCIVDEAYYEYADITVVDLVEKYENLIVTRTFSKAFSLGAVRLGYAVSAEKNMKEVQKAKELLPESVNKIAQIAGIAALNDFGYIRKNVASVKKARKYLAAELTKVGCIVYPSSSNFLLVRFGSLQEAVFIKEKLEERGIFLRDRTTKPKCVGCLRIGMPLEGEAKKILSEIKEVVKKFKEQKEKKVILFDMDGVLVDVGNSYRKVIQETAQFFTKQKVSQEEIQEYKQKGGYNNDWDLTEALICARGISKQKSEIIEKFQELYLGENGKKGYIDNENWLLREKVLKQLQKKFVLGIVTGRPKEEAQYVLNKYKCTSYFDVLIAMQDCPSGKSKPDPYSLNLALQKLGTENRADVTYIGDTIDDMKASCAAEVRAIGCISPSAVKKILEPLLVQNGAKMVIENVNQIIRVI